MSLRVALVAEIKFESRPSVIGRAKYACGSQNRKLRVASANWAAITCPAFVMRWPWVKNRYPKWNPGEWKHGPKAAVP